MALITAWGLKRRTWGSPDEPSGARLQRHPNLTEQQCLPKESAKPRQTKRTSRGERSWSFQTSWVQQAQVPLYPCVCKEQRSTSVKQDPWGGAEKAGFINKIFSNWSDIIRTSSSLSKKECPRGMSLHFSTYQDHLQLPFLKHFKKWNTLCFKAILYSAKSWLIYLFQPGFM